MRQLVRYNGHVPHVRFKRDERRVRGAPHGGHDDQAQAQAGDAGAQSDRLLHPALRQLGVCVLAVWV
jgi:hypothetical protein